MIDVVEGPRGYVDWPEGTEASSIDELAGLLEVDVGDIDDWVHGKLAEDPGDVQVEQIDDSIAIMTLGGRVNMWCLELPFTSDQFDAYLVECDDRTTIAKCLMSFPSEEEWRADGQVTILPELADLCSVSTEEFVAALGYRWEPIDLDWMGNLSEPDVYLLWNARHIVGIDDCNLHVWSPLHSDAVPGVRVRRACRASGHLGRAGVLGRPDFGFVRSDAVAAHQAAAVGRVAATSDAAEGAGGDRGAVRRAPRARKP